VSSRAARRGRLVAAGFPQHVELARTGGTGSGAVALPTETAVVQVRQGENLSSLASRVAPGAPTSAVVQRIVDLNGLGTVAVRTGQALVVPAGG